MQCTDARSSKCQLHGSGSVDSAEQKSNIGGRPFLTSSVKQANTHHREPTHVYGDDVGKGWLEKEETFNRRLSTGEGARVLAFTVVLVHACAYALRAGSCVCVRLRVPLCVCARADARSAGVAALRRFGRTMVLQALPLAVGLRGSAAAAAPSSSLRSSDDFRVAVGRILPARAA
eukprot:6174578-Pleurochrysis_carterae.AAC.4